MTQPFLILVSGPPASGKTTLSKRISDDLKIPAFSKDGLKEMLFDRIGFKERELSKQFGRICSETLWHIAETEIISGNSLILESNFDPDFAKLQLDRLEALSSLKVVEVFCHAPKDILIDRFVERIRRGERHPGHGDTVIPEQIAQQYFQRDSTPLGFSEHCIDFDSTDLSNLQFEDTLKTLRAWVLGGG
jgi:predicted kinase